MKTEVLSLFIVFLVTALGGAAEAQSFAAAPQAVPMMPPPVLPTDVTNLNSALGVGAASFLGPVEMPQLNPVDAVKRLKDSDFPIAPICGSARASQSASEINGGILVKAANQDCQYRIEGPGDIQLTEGAIFVSVRKPARLALINTPHAIIAVAQDAEVIVSFANGILRLQNLSGIGERVKVRIHHAAVSATVNGVTYGEAKTEGIVMAIKLGHELLASDYPLNQSSLRPHDGLSRRRIALFENNCQAVSEISLEAALQNCPLLTNLSQPDAGRYERHIFKDLARMAAVLNYNNGQGGYDAQAR